MLIMAPSVMVGLFCLVSMSVIEAAQRAWKKQSQQIELTFTKSDESETATLFGIGTRHSLSMDTDGIPVKMPNNHVSFHEELFNEANPNYIIRPNNGDEIKMRGDRVTFNDSTGTPRTHLISEVWPDQTVGMIVCILQNEEDSYI